MLTGTKAQYRAAVLAARRHVSLAEYHTEAQALCAHLDTLVDVSPHAQHNSGPHPQHSCNTGLKQHTKAEGMTVCTYLPVGTEPGSTAFVDRLYELYSTVLLPVTHISADGQSHTLYWGRYTPGQLVTGRFGLSEPPQPWLPPETVTEATVVLVPALAVDRRGVRLGRGAGFYDRCLAQCAPQTPLVAVVRDSELVDELPQEPHDICMTHALTPSFGLIKLGAGV